MCVCVYVCVQGVSDVSMSYYNGILNSVEPERVSVPVMMHAILEQASVTDTHTQSHTHTQTHTHAHKHTYIHLFAPRHTHAAFCYCLTKVAFAGTADNC